MTARCDLCRIDGIPILLDLGVQPPGDRLLEPWELGEAEPRQPVRLGLCPGCGILQRADPSVEGFGGSGAGAGSLAQTLGDLQASLQPRGAAGLDLADVAALTPAGFHQAFDPAWAYLPTVGRLRELLQARDLEAFQVERCPGAPGRLRLLVGRRGVFPVAETVARRILDEEAQSLGTAAFWQHLGQEVTALRDRLTERIRRIRAEGERLCGFGASACGSLLLNHCGLGRDGFDALDFVIDPDGRSVGRLTPGSHLALLPMDELDKRFIKHLLVLDPSLADEARDRTGAWRAGGGRILDPWNPAAA
ncbi:MAG: hypothetical protein ACKPAH_15475 [Verrucomicrobiota bacterium]